MRKILIGICIIMSALAVLSCGDKELTAINAGLYEIEFNLKYEDQPIVVKQRMRYNDDGSYEATTFNNNVAVEELRGKYKIEDKKLVYYDKYRRVITQDGTWATWYKMESSSVDVRNINENSFQYNFIALDEKAREQYKMLGVSEGWKTYSRISG
ncbi:MAG: hypothetical protein NT072_09440 [Deltaproteobacteria bacterium]|nr:hypothetical protein [Deltaproteobacteria bacterium]